MPLHIIIDGYNLIRRSPTLKRADERSLEEGREALIDLLAAYKRIKAHKITVVFDGGGIPVQAPRTGRNLGIEVRFSAPGQTADSVIKKMASKEGERALVVSSDRAVMEFASSAGAAVVDSRKFEELMERAMMDAAAGAPFDAGQKTDPWPGTTRKKGPSRRPPKRERKNRRKSEKL